MKNNKSFIWGLPVLLLAFGLVLAGRGGADPLVTVPVRTDASIKKTFSISAAGTQGVTDTFNAVSAYLRGKTAAQVLSEGHIQLGDWIDLPSITVGTATVNDQAITPASLPFDGYEGRLLRLIVVGINSFNEGQGGSYTGNGNGTAAHLVFQFQNLPFAHRMSSGWSRESGYAAREMRAWITGDFLTGLKNAGVPENVLWGPKRYVANGGPNATAADEITDTLWLPTEREICGVNFWSHSTWETAANQARLAYYDTSSKFIKHDSGNGTTYYWLSSTGSYSYLVCCVTPDGLAYETYGETRRGCAPAFCVR
jgi:hypothetical protein